MKLEKYREPTHLGDAVYVRFDGYRLVLETDDPAYPTNTIAIDPSVYANLVDYCERLNYDVERENEDN